MTLHSSDRYFKDGDGNTVFLTGYYGWCSPDPNTFLQGQTNTYDQAIAAMVAVGMNYMRLSLGINRGSTANPTPFKFITPDFNLGIWEETFFDGLVHYCDLAHENGIILHVCIFDGVDIRAGDGDDWYRWEGSYWNIDNQTTSFFGDIDVDTDGNADEDGDFYRTTDFNNRTGVGLYQKNLIDRVLKILNQYSNVMIEIGNETFQGTLAWNTAVYDYCKLNTDLLVTQNTNASETGLYSGIDGHSEHDGDTPADVKVMVAALIGQGYPFWIDPDGSDIGYWDNQGTPDNRRKAMWYCLAGGAAGWGGWASALGEGQTGEHPNNLAYGGFLQSLLASSALPLGSMTPSQSLITNTTENSCLASSTHALVYVLNDALEIVDVSGFTASTKVSVFDPITGDVSDEVDVSSLSDAEVVKPTGLTDWAILVQPTGAGLAAGDFDLSVGEAMTAGALDALDAVHDIYTVVADRRVLLSYNTGPLAKLKRTSDSAELDWYPDPSLEHWMNGPAITAWAPGGHTVIIRYDQSGNGRNWTPDAGSTGHALDLSGTHPVCDFTGSTQYQCLGALAVFQNQGAGSIIGVRKFDSQTGNQILAIVSKGDSTGSARAQIDLNTTTLRAGGRRLDANSFVSISALTSDTAWGVQIARFDWTNSNLYHRVEGNADSNTSFQTDGSTSNTASLAVSMGAAGSGTPASGMDGKVSCIALVRGLLTDQQVTDTVAALAALKL